MNLTSNYKNLSSQMQQGAKTVSVSLTQKALRLLTGFFIGLVFALILQQLLSFGSLVLVFTTLVIMLMIYRLLRNLSIWQIIVLDAFCVLVANSLRMYIMMAP